MCRMKKGIFEVLCDKFKAHHNETIPSLQYRKLIREENKNAEEWMDHLRVKNYEYACKDSNNN